MKSLKSLKDIKRRWGSSQVMFCQGCTAVVFTFCLVFSCFVFRLTFSRWTAAQLGSAQVSDSATAQHSTSLPWINLGLFSKWTSDGCLCAVWRTEACVWMWAGNLALYTSQFYTFPPTWSGCHFSSSVLFQTDKITTLTLSTSKYLWTWLHVHLFFFLPMFNTFKPIQNDS